MTNNLFSISAIEATPLPSCDFEGTCNYKTVTNQHFIPWIKTSLSNHPNITDHTYDTLSGKLSLPSFLFLKI